jgi:arsenate reductase
MKKRVLILCTGNSARSQMAEGLLRTLSGGAIVVESAGTAPSQVHPLAIRALAERGIDITQQRSKHLREFLDLPFDVVITDCDQAAQACPLFPGKAERIHWSFPDPAAVQGTEEDRLASFRTVCAAIEERLSAWLQTEQAEGV